MATKVITMMLMTWCLLGLTSARPGGAPEAACQNMDPSYGHGGAQAQNDVSPFKVLVSPRSGRLVNVTLVSPDIEKQFKGFILQARPSENSINGIAQGTFINFDPNISKASNCSGGTENSLTHVSRDGKTNVEVTWVAPEDGTTDIVFLATFVQQYDKFWIGVTSDVVHM